MENFPSINTHVTIDEFYDVTLRTTIRNRYAVFETDSEPLTPEMHIDPNLIGQTGVLKVHHTQHGQVWRFFAYEKQSMRRLPEGDDLTGWGWECLSTGLTVRTEVGAVPTAQPFERGVPPKVMPQSGGDYFI
ncbi:hypothetical protein [Paraburkholderia sp. 32]|uniref:hypothetical protein n=1 Tax=Paraburkholderia sp. 32 TaxID=2991057 RepID=UPI003D221D78